WMEREAMRSEESRRYWREKVEGVVVTRIGEEGEGGGEGIGMKENELGEELGEGVKELGRRLGVPVKSVMLAAHMRVMSLLSGGGGERGGDAWEVGGGGWGASGWIIFEHAADKGADGREEMGRVGEGGVLGRGEDDGA